MFILVILLTILSIPKVWPNTTSSELASTIEDGETGFKRQPKFFDLLQQFLEKYANEQLAPLKALVDYKQYETMPVPDQYSQLQPSQKVVDDPNPQQNKPNLMCRKINLCSIQNQASSKAPGYNTNSPITLRKPLNSNTYLPSFHSNTNYYARTPLDDSYRKEFRNIPTQLKPSIKYYNWGNNSFINFPVNQDILNRLLVGATYANRKQAKKSTTGPEMILGSVFEKNVEPILAETFKNCSCSQNITCQEHPEKTKTNKKLSSSESEISTYSEIVGLFSELEDIMVRNDNKEDLQPFLENLKALKSQMEIVITRKGSTTFPTLATTQEPPMVGAKVPIVYDTDAVGGDIAQIEEDEKANATRNLNSQDFKSNKSNGSDVDSLTTNKTPIKSTLKPALDPSNKVSINSTDYISEILSIALNITENSTDSQRNLNNETIILLTTLLDKNIPRNSQQNSTKPKDNTKDILNKKNIETPNSSTLKVSTSKTIGQKPSSQDQLKNSNFTQPIDFRKPADVKSIKLTDEKNDSKITISITSNGRFKNIQVEQQVPESSEKYLEINEKENIKNTAPSSKVRITDDDMMGTDSRNVNVVKHPKKRDRYTAPILPEIYSGKSKFKTKPPLGIYWHTIEENASVKNKQPTKFWKSFKSAENNDSSSKENVSTLLTKGLDYADIEDINGSECEVLT